MLDQICGGTVLNGGIPDYRDGVAVRRIVVIAALLLGKEVVCDAQVVKVEAYDRSGIVELLRECRAHSTGKIDDGEIVTVLEVAVLHSIHADENSYALDDEAWAWLNLGEPDNAIANDIRARQLWLAAGDARNAAKALHGIAIDQKDKGTFAEAQKSFEEALKEFRRIGATWDTASCSHNLGVLFWEEGKLALAGESLNEALRIQRAQNDKRGISFDLDGLGSVALSAGQLSSAKEMKEQALQGFREIGDKRGESIVLRSLGEILCLQGDLSAATEKYNQAMVLQKEISYKTGLAFSQRRPRGRRSCCHSGPTE